MFILSPCCNQDARAGFLPASELSLVPLLPESSSLVIAGRIMGLVSRLATSRASSTAPPRILLPPAQTGVRPAPGAGGLLSAVHGLALAGLFGFCCNDVSIGGGVAGVGRLDWSFYGWKIIGWNFGLHGLLNFR